MVKIRDSRGAGAPTPPYELKPADPESELDPAELVPLGGGWYELPNGERIQGRDAALETLKALKALRDEEQS